MRRICARAFARVLGSILLAFAAAPGAASACSLAAGAPPGQYAGECLNGLAHGRGVARSPAYSYEGEFFEGQRHGRGLLIVTGGHRYEGEFRHGKRHGQAVTILADGSRHEGSWRDGETNGWGKLTDTKGYVYEGEFKDSQYSGRGVLTGPNGTRYDGNWRGGKRNGQGLQLYEDGSMAEGEFVDNRFVRGTHHSADRRTVRTYENGAIVQVSGPGAPSQAPAPAAPARTAAQACHDDAGSCETRCAAGTLIGLLITQGKGDAEKARGDCVARCAETKAQCLASAQPAPVPPTATGGSAGPQVTGAGRQYCPRAGQWCMYDRISDAQPYRELKKACSFFWGHSDMERIRHLGVLDTLDPAVLEKWINEVPAPGSPNHEYFRDRAAVARCFLESGLRTFSRRANEHFRIAPEDDRHALLLPRSMWDEIVQHTKSLEAKNYSTASFDPGNDRAKEDRYYAAHRKCGGVLGAYVPATLYPLAWWEENLRSLEEIARQGTAWRQGLSPILNELNKFRCHKAEGWPYAAENQLWVKYNRPLRKNR